MYKLLRSSLTSPKELSHYVNKKTKKFVFYIFFLVALIILPNMLYVSFSYGYSRSMNTQIIEAINENKNPEYKIENGILSFTGTEEKKSNILIASFSNYIVKIPVYLSFDIAGNTYEIDNPLGLSIVLSKEKMTVEYFTSRKSDSTKLSSTTMTRKIIKEMDYNDINIDFNKASTTNYAFFGEFLKLGNRVFDSLKGYVLGIYLPIVAISSLLSSALMLIFVGGLLWILNRYLSVSFSKMIKITILGSMPYALGFFFATLFQLNFIMFVAQLISFFFIFRILNYYVLNRRLQERGSTNEL